MTHTSEHNDSRLKSILGIFLGLSSLLLLWFTQQTPSFLAWAYSNISYYLIAGLFIFWVTSIFFYFKNHPVSMLIWSRFHWAGILAALILTLIVSASVKPYFRILSDETNLLSISKSMVESRTVDNITMGKWYYENFHPENHEFEKRPLAFPFFTHLIHIVRGYQPENPFILNHLVLFGLLLLLYEIAFCFLGRWNALLVMIVSASQPVLSQCAASAGYDLLSAFMTLLGLRLLWSYLQTKSFSTFCFLWTTLLLNANIRYESAVLLFAVVFFLILFRQLKLPLSNWLWILPLSFTVNLPLIWLFMKRAVSKNVFETPDSILAFSLQHFLSNNKQMAKALLQFDFFIPFAVPVILIGLCGALAFFEKIIRRKIKLQPSSFFFALITGFYLIFIWGTMTSYHMGDLSHPSQSRLALFPVLMLSFFAIWTLDQSPRLRKNRIFSAILCIAVFCLYHPLSIQNQFSNTLFLPREYRLELKYLQKLKSHNILVITDRPGQFTVHNYGAVNFAHANENKESILDDFKRHLFTDIIVFQEISYDTNMPLEYAQLDHDFSLEPQLEIQNKAEAFIRISKVKHQLI